jgi:Tfp pilus assembly protein PilF
MAPAHFVLGLALLQRGEDQEARKHFEFVVQSDPNDYQAQFQLGNILLNEGAYESAAVRFRKASESPQPDLRAAALDRLRAAKEKRRP